MFTKGTGFWAMAKWSIRSERFVPVTAMYVALHLFEAMPANTMPLWPQESHSGYDIGGFGAVCRCE